MTPYYSRWLGIPYPAARHIERRAAHTTTTAPVEDRRPIRPRNARPARRVTILPAPPLPAPCGQQGVERRGLDRLAMYYGP